MERGLTEASRCAGDHQQIITASLDKTIALWSAQVSSRLPSMRSPLAAVTPALLQSGARTAGVNSAPSNTFPSFTAGLSPAAGAQPSGQPARVRGRA